MALIGGNPALARWSADFRQLPLGPLSSSLPGGLSFSRASTATVETGNGVWVGIQADVPRIGRPLVSGALVVGKSDPMLVIEEARTNRLKNSEDVTSNWTLNGGAVVSASTAAPPVTGNAAPLASASLMLLQSGSASSIAQSLNFQQSLGGTSRTISLYCRATSSFTQGHKLALPGPSSAATTQYSNLFTETNSWTRRSFTATVSLPVDTPTGNVRDINSDVTLQSASLYVWGLQCENGGFPTEFIETSILQASRQGDYLYHADASQLVKNGQLSFEVVFVPKGDVGAYSNFPVIWATADGLHYAYVDSTTSLVNVVLGDSIWTSAATVSWSAFDVIDLYVTAGPKGIGVEYSRNGGAITLVDQTSAAFPSVPADAGIDLLSIGGSQQLSAWVMAMYAWAPANPNGGGGSPVYQPRTSAVKPFNDVGKGIYRRIG